MKKISILLLIAMLLPIMAWSMTAASRLFMASSIVYVVPASPTGHSATAGDGLNTLNPGSSSGATSYNGYWTNDGNDPTTGSTKLTGVTNGQTHTSLTNGGLYKYGFTAANTAGESGISSIDTAIPWHLTNLSTNLGSISNNTVIDNIKVYKNNGGTISVPGDGTISFVNTTTNLQSYFVPNTNNSLTLPYRKEIALVSGQTTGNFMTANVFLVVENVYTPTYNQTQANFANYWKFDIIIRFSNASNPNTFQVRRWAARNATTPTYWNGTTWSSTPSFVGGFATPTAIDRTVRLERTTSSYVITIFQTSVPSNVLATATIPFSFYSGWSSYVSGDTLMLGGCPDEGNFTSGTDPTVYKFIGGI